MLKETYLLYMVGIIGMFVGSTITFIGCLIILNKFRKRVDDICGVNEVKDGN